MNGHSKLCKLFLISMKKKMERKGLEWPKKNMDIFNKLYIKISFKI